MKYLKLRQKNKNFAEALKTQKKQTKDINTKDSILLKWNSGLIKLQRCFFCHLIF